MFISPVVIVILFSVTLTNLLLFNIFSIGFSFLATVLISYIIAKLITKKDIRARDKKTSVNYRLVAFIIFIVGSALIAFDTILSDKLNGYLLFIVMLGIVLSLRTHNISKANNVIDISELHTSKYVLFLRSFDSNKILSKPKNHFHYLKHGSIYLEKK